ncbi:MAG: DUF4446 family protein [Selenomonadaceae bacterium]|nr:DUF4446 family protein [Selenomonadaceae bacterium]
MNAIGNLILNHQTAIILSISICTLGLLILTISLNSKINQMRGLYSKMMTDSSGESIEEMLVTNSQKLERIIDDQRFQEREIRDIKDLLQNAITRVGIVRFAAFDDVGSDLSFAVALLDENKNGFLLTSIFSRSEARSYVKPIEAGASNYKLIDEEVQALREAMR